MPPLKLESHSKAKVEPCISKPSTYNKPDPFKGTPYEKRPNAYDLYGYGKVFETPRANYGYYHPSLVEGRWSHTVSITTVLTTDSLGSQHKLLLKTIDKP